MVPLRDDVPAMKNQEPIGLARCEEGADRLALSIDFECNLVDRLMSGKQDARWAGTAPDRGGGQQVGDVLERASVPGCAIPRVFRDHGSVRQSETGCTGTTHAS